MPLFRRHRLCVAQVFLVLLSGCGQSGPVRIGDAYPRYDDNLPFLKAIAPAVESTGVEVVQWSTKGDPGSSIQLNTEQATLFANDPRVVGVVGHTGSRDALLGAVVYNDRGVPQVVPNATSALLGHAGPWTFTLVPSDSVEGVFIADFALDSLQAKRISVLYLGDEYGMGLRDGVRSALRRRGTDVADVSMIPTDWCLAQPAAEIHSSIIRASMRRAQPDVVVVTTGSVSGWCVAEAVHAVNPDAWILFGDGMDGARVMPELPLRVNSERIRGVEFWAPGGDSLNTAFVDRVQKALNRPPAASHALQYDAFMLLSAAVRDAGPNRKAIRRWLESLGVSREPWQGVTGPIAFNRPRSEILRMGGPTVSVR
jgi:ABC-type branched-subunit amino acid transport system substrate-binding protein